MAAWLSLAEFRSQFRPPPSRDTVEAWVRAGAVEKWQPGGPGGKTYYRARDSRVPDTEQQLLEALDAAETAQSRKRRA